LPRPASIIPICYARAQSSNCAGICTGTDREIVQAPRPAAETTGRDLPQRSGHRRVMTETIPTKKQNGLPPGSVRPINQEIKP
jgi:hypothetical protein